MAKIVLSTMGSLGDLHPMIALGLELKTRGHNVIINSWEGYAEKIALLGFEFAPLRPTVDPEDREFIKKAMDSREGSATVIREMVLPYLDDMYEDLKFACEGADAMVTGELLYVAKSLHELTGINWVTTTLSPLTLFSFHDPGIYPGAGIMEYLRPMPAVFHRAFFEIARLTIKGWFEPYKDFRRRLGLDPDHDPVFFGKFSEQCHLAMFSRAFAAPQPDWPPHTIQTGFCFYDGQEDEGKMPDDLQEFLDKGDDPIVFTLGSAAVMDARDFFDESAKAAAKLGRRAILLYGRDNAPPKGLTDKIVGFDYAPFSRVLPHAACVVHQGGVGTTGQVLRAGVPHLIMPYGHDQLDNAMRCRRIGVGEVINRDSYNADRAANMLDGILSDSKYAKNAAEKRAIIETERGAEAACDAIEKTLR
ncbi:MAG: glycosyltransferase [Pyrinomonadaceae bacterium]